MSYLAQLTTTELAGMLAKGPVVAIVPVGSTEPHGPHLPLSTDARISEGVAEGAVAALAKQNITALVAPTVPYGVTDFAAGFRGAIGVSAAALTAFLRAIVDALLADGFAHVCLVNNHLEPAHDVAVRAAVIGLEGRASVACPLTRRWARTLSAEFKSGACHAGEYETSLVLAIDEAAVRGSRSGLPALDLSLSSGIKSGLTTFAAIGMTDAYTGAPAAASIAEGSDLIAKLVAMTVTEIVEGMALKSA